MPDWDKCLELPNYWPAHLEEYIQDCSTHKIWRDDFLLGGQTLLIVLGILLLFGMILYVGKSRHANTT